MKRSEQEWAELADRCDADLQIPITPWRDLGGSAKQNAFASLRRCQVIRGCCLSIIRCATLGHTQQLVMDMMEIQATARCTSADKLIDEDWLLDWEQPDVTATRDDLMAPDTIETTINLGIGAAIATLANPAPGADGAGTITEAMIEDAWAGAAKIVGVVGGNDA